MAALPPLSPPPPLFRDLTNFDWITYELVAGHGTFTWDTTTKRGWALYQGLKAPLVFQEVIDFPDGGAHYSYYFCVADEGNQKRAWLFEVRPRAGVQDYSVYYYYNPANVIAAGWARQR